MKDTALQIYNAYNRAKLKEESERKVWIQCYEYVNNWVDGNLGQWKSDVRNNLGDKPAISFNEIRKFVNRICGAQRQAKLDEKVYPRDEGSDPIISDILTDLLKYVKDCNRAELAIARMFRDGIITGRGFIKTEWSDENDYFGEVTIKSINPLNVYLIGESDEYDVSKGYRGVIEEIPLDKDELLSRWSDKEDEIEGLARSVDTGIEVASTVDYGFGKSISTDGYYDKEDGKFKVLRSQRYEYKDVKFFQDLETQKLTEAPSEKKDYDLGKQLLEASGVKYKEVKRKKKYLKIAYTVGDVLLEESESDKKYFDITGFFCYLDNGKITGVVQDLLDPQDEKNKRRSQIIHILGTSAKGGYFFQDGALDPEKAKKELGTVSPLIAIKGSINEKIQPIVSNLQAIPAIAQMEASASMEMREISGLSDASLGVMPEGARSGRAVQALQMPTETIIAEIFDNYMNTRRIVWGKVLDLIQTNYNTEKRVRILGDYTSKFLPPQAIQMKQMMIMQLKLANPLLTEEEAIMKSDEMLQVMDGSKLLTINKIYGDRKLNDITVGKYDVAIDQVAQNPTMRRAEYFDKLNMKSLGAPVKWSTIIRSYDGRGKEQMLEDAIEAEQMMQMMGQLAQLAPQDKTATPNQATEHDLQFNAAGAQNPL